MTFKKAEMAKTLENGLSMIETNLLNHNWSHFVILSGLTLHQFQKKLLLRVIFDQWLNLHLGLDALSNQKILKGIYCLVRSNCDWNMKVIQCEVHIVQFHSDCQLELNFPLLRILDVRRLYFHYLNAVNTDLLFNFHNSLLNQEVE